MAIDALEFPELHDESIPYMTFVRNCAKLLSSAGVRDFNMQVRCCRELNRPCVIWPNGVSVQALGAENVAWHEPVCEGSVQTLAVSFRMSHC